MMTRAQGRLKGHVQETVREIPVQAARLALFGVGRTLLLTDRVRKDYKEAREVGLRPVLERWRDDAGHVAGKVMGRVSERMPARGRSASKPTPEPPVARPPGAPEAKVTRPPAAPEAAPKAKAAPEAKAKAAPDPTPAPPVPEPTQTPGRVTKIAAGSLPVPDYDDATLASVRARLRTLTAAQVCQLRDYEQEHEARPDFLRMFDNRIAKLTSGS